jgi:hypothetical protein
MLGWREDWNSIVQLLNYGKCSGERMDLSCVMVQRTTALKVMKKTNEKYINQHSQLSFFSKNLELLYVEQQTKLN